MTVRLRVQSSQGPPADYDLDGPEILIGRATTSTIVIADARASRQHARLKRRDDGWWVEDLGARNPTLLNGVPVTGSLRLSSGDTLEIGDSLVQFIGEGIRAEPAKSETAKRAPVRDSARMWTLNEIHRALANPMSLAELLDFILARCFELLAPEEGVVMLRGADGTLAVAASRGGQPGEAVPVPRRLIDEVSAKGKPALTLDAAADERFAGSHSVVSSGLRSVVAAPLADAEGPIGLIALFSRMAIRPFAQPDLDMLVSIAGAAALRVRNVALADELAARRVVEHELALAHDVQMSLLPPNLPSHPDLTVAARLQPARSVGGDLYDFVLDGDRLWFVVADVAGKSVAAALYMAIVRTLFRATVGGGAAVEAVASRMNAELARDNERMMFVTAMLGCLDVRAGELAIVDAGHGPALLIDAAGAVSAAAVPKSMAFGVVGDAGYSAARLRLARGSMLFLFTDGVTEARNPAGEMFGMDRLRHALRGAPAPAAAIGWATKAVEDFAAGAPPDDDVTVFALRYGS